MPQLFLKIFDFLQQRRVLSLILALALVAGAVFLAKGLRYGEDISEFLPSNPETERYSEVYNALSQKNNIILLFRGDDAYAIGEAVAAFERNWEALDTTGLVSEPQFFADEGSAFAMMDFLRANIPYFLTEDDYARADSILASPEARRDQLASARKALLFPSGQITADAVSADPMGLFAGVTARLREASSAEGWTVSDGVVFTPDGTGLAFMTSPYGMSESGKNAEISRLIDKAAAATMAEVPEVRVSATGGPLIAVSNASQIKRDSVLAISLAALLILLLLFISYRKFSDLLWVFVSVAFGWIFALGAVAIVHQSISIIIIGIASIIIGIAVNYPLHFMDILKEGKPVREVLREMVQPLLVGNITTVAAFLCLLWLDAAAMRDFGLFGGLMLVGTILFVLIFLPQFARAHEATPMRVNLGEILPDRSIRNPWLLLAVVAITLVLGWFSRGIRFDADMNHINYMTASQREDMALLAGTQNAQEWFAVAQGSDLERALVANDCLLQTIKAPTKGPGNLLPSKEEQERRLEKWRSFISAHPTLIADLHKEAKAEGFAAGAFGPFERLVSTEYLVQPAEFFEPVLKVYDGTYVIAGGDHSVIAGCDRQSQKVAIINKVYSAERPQVPEGRDDVMVFSGQDVSGGLVKVLSGSFDYIGTICSLVVFIFLLLSFRRVETAILAFLPLAVSWLWILGSMSLMGISFNIVNIILATFIFGQGDDYTIFITEGLMYEYAYGRKRMVTYKNSVLVSALIMFIGIGALVVAKHPAMRSLAVVTIIGMLIVVLMAYYLPPLVFGWLTRKNGRPREIPITLGRIGRSLFAILFVFVFFWGCLYPYTFVYFLFGSSEERKLRYHRTLQRIAGWICRHVPGVDYEWANPHGETFGKPGIVICNHQSHLDLICLMMLSPRLVFVTNHWVWHNPIYGYLLRKLEYYPAENGIGDNVEALRDYIRRGYSIVIFPEGTRSEDGSIGRFHQGAFMLAKELGVDIIPVFVHGAYDVLPKHDFMLRRGAIYCEVGVRQPLAELPQGQGSAASQLAVAKAWRQYYIREYARIRAERETPEYWWRIVRYKYLYKGVTEMFGAEQIVYALCHPDEQVVVTDPDPDNIALANNIAGLPQNIRFEVG